MPIKTKDGWKTREQLERQEKAWKKAREKLVIKLGGMDKLNNEGVIRKAACDVFKEIDSDGNGKIDPEELKDAMSKMGVKLTAKEVDRMMIEADQDGDGEIDGDEFQDVCIAQVELYKNVTTSMCTLQ